MNPPVSLVCLYPLPFIIFLLETPSPDSLLLRRYIFQIYFNYFSLQLCLQVEFLFSLSTWMMMCYQVLLLRKVSISSRNPSDMQSHVKASHLTEKTHAGACRCVCEPGFVQFCHSYMINMEPIHMHCSVKACQSAICYCVCYVPTCISQYECVFVFANKH